MLWEASRRGYGKLAMIAACCASAGARRESNATLKLLALNYTELEQAKLKILKTHFKKIA